MTLAFEYMIFMRINTQLSIVPICACLGSIIVVLVGFRSQNPYNQVKSKEFLISES